jgi:hypothetical protein
VVGSPVSKKIGNGRGMQLEFQAASWELVVKASNQSSSKAWMGGPTNYKTKDWKYNSSTPSTYTVAGPVLKDFAALDRFSKMPSRKQKLNMLTWPQANNM